MRLLRGLAGALLWIVSALLGLVAAILCVTIVLLPVGLPLLGYAGRLLALSMKLMLPRAVSHPVDTAGKSIRKQGRKAKDSLSATAAHDFKKLRKQSRKQALRVNKKIPIVS
jgi:hypothetical protein